MIIPLDTCGKHCNEQYYNMTTGILTVKGDQVVDKNGPVILRGAAIGGWMK